MRTKLLSLLLAMLLLFGTAAMAEEVTTATLEGLITEVDDGYFVMDDITQGTVQVNLNDDTAYDGIVTKDTLTVGEYVYVTYNGIMTRSEPPQVTAKKVACYRVTGTVTTILDNGFTVEGDETIGTVIVHADATQPPVYSGVAITLYYNGVLALSYPPQITAAYIIVPTLEGTASAIDGSTFTLTTADQAAYTVTVTADTAVLTLPAEGESLLIYYSGTATDGSVTALALTTPDGQTTHDDM